MRNRALPELELPHTAFPSVCLCLARQGAKLRLDASDIPGRRAKKRIDRLGRDLRMAEMELEPKTVILAGKTLSLLLLVSNAIALAVAILLSLRQFLIPLAFSLVVAPIIGLGVLESFAKNAARKRSIEILKGSPESVNLMIMSLRHEPSLSKAIAFASRKDNAFSAELRRCIWGVVMGIHDSFEEALHGLGARWKEQSGELKDSLSAMVTASLEGTEDGKRRALDRANTAMVSGAKRRIEEYALSLSSPSMILFGLGILLPLMVGSFLPMLTWNMWSMDPETPGQASRGESTIETVFLMNILFPAIATVVAMNAVSRHPLEYGGGREALTGNEIAVLALVCAASICSAAIVPVLLRSDQTPLVMLLIGSCPGSIWLVACGRNAKESSGGEELEDALFRTGSRMVDGENFEAALGRTGNELGGDASGVVKRLAFRTNASGQDFDLAAEEESISSGSYNSVEAFRIVRDASSKDELAAGTLAMDLAVYLRDLRVLDRALRNRLKPTISMMKMTVYALGPVVLGVTYAIYLTLSSMMDGGQGGMRSWTFLLALGAFLAETDIVVCYFIWGIQGSKSIRHLMYSIGSCVITSELVFAMTSTLAA